MSPPPPSPARFDIDMIVRDRRDLVTPVMSSASSDTGTILNAQEQYLTTILERTETNTLETLERIRRAKAQAQREAQVRRCSLSQKKKKKGKRNGAVHVHKKT